MMADCPFHGPNCRHDPRFDELDRLIALGWGSVPGNRIEAVLRKNKGVLPPGPGEPDPDGEDFAAWATRARSRGVSKREIVLCAIEAGYLSSNEIAAVATGADLSPEGASAALSALRDEGRIVECGITYGKHGHAMRQYRIAEHVAVARAAAGGRV
jgi:hypothetical protein